MARRLVDFANEAGGHDNITVVVVDLPLRPPPPTSTRRKEPRPNDASRSRPTRTSTSPPGRPRSMPSSPSRPAPTQVDGTTAEKAVVLIVDTSGSMSSPGSKIRAARRATATAVDLIPDGTWFAVIAGSHRAWCVYPPAPAGQWPAAGPGRRPHPGRGRPRLPAAAGHRRHGHLDLARPRPGRCSSVAPAPSGSPTCSPTARTRASHGTNLEAALARATGVFQCDARGVGVDWNVEELRLITSALLGQVEIISEPDQMDDDFKDFLERAHRQERGRRPPAAVGAAGLEAALPAPGGAVDRGPDRQGQPRSTPSPATSPPASWAPGESRDYHVCIEVPPGRRRRREAGRPGSAWWSTASPQSQSLVRAVWTEDMALSTGSTPTWPTTPARRSWPTPSSRGSRPASRATTPRPPIRLGRAVQLAHRVGQRGHGAAAPEGGRRRRPGHRNGPAAAGRRHRSTRWRSTPGRRERCGSPPRPAGDGDRRRDPRDRDLSRRPRVGDRRLLRRLRRGPGASRRPPLRRRPPPGDPAAGPETGRPAPTAARRTSPETPSARCADWTSPPASCRSRRLRPRR